MTKISSLKWILCGYQLTFIVKIKCTSKWFNKSNYFDGYSIQKRCLFNSFNVYLCENRIILRNDRYFLLQLNHWLELNVRDVSFYCSYVCICIERGRQNLNIVSSITATVYSYLNLTFTKSRFRLGVMHHYHLHPLIWISSHNTNYNHQNLNQITCN